VHAAFEHVGWVDEAAPVFPEGEGGSVVAALLKIPRIRAIFERKGRVVELHREQPVDAVFDGVWVSGVMDRLHLHRDSSGAVKAVEIIDFKTDSVEDLQELARRYVPQMNAYRVVMQRAYPDARVGCLLISTRCGDIVEL
jgi:ATP-dependent exoDNAse (exonuclease V) beta subunit